VQQTAQPIPGIPSTQPLTQNSVLLCCKTIVNLFHDLC